jgi:hypothetical protein
VTDSGPKIFGYASAFSAAAGQTLSFHVSGERADRYTAQLVRLRHGHDAPGSPGLRETQVASAVDGIYRASHHAARTGSSIEVIDPERLLMPQTRLEFGVLIWATTPALDRPQGILGAWSEDERAGYALYLDRGQLVLAIGDGTEASTVRLAAELRPRTWYAVTGGWSAASHSGWLVQECCDRRFAQT